MDLQVLTSGTNTNLIWSRIHSKNTFYGLLGVAVVVGARSLARLWDKIASKREPVKLIYQNSLLNEWIIRDCPSIKEYSCAWWASNGHLQTLYVNLCREWNAPTSASLFKREEIRAMDGGTIVLDWTDPLGTGLPDVTLVIVPGICSSSEASSIRHFVQRCRSNTRLSIRTVVYNPRGCTGPLTTPRFFLYADTVDFRHALEHIQKKVTTPIYAVGFSMGGNMVTKYVGEYSQMNQDLILSGVVSISQGYDGAAGIKHLVKSPYNKLILSALKSILKRNEHVFKDVIDIQPVLKRANSVEDFDRMFICKLHGFKDTEDYYTKHSSISYLSFVRIPVLLANAEDDPLVPFSLIPFSVPLENKNLILATTHRGGHLGWIESSSSLFASDHWHERLALEFIESLFHLDINI